MFSNSLLVLYLSDYYSKEMANTGGGAENPIDNDDNERAKEKQVAGASSSMTSESTSSNTSNRGNTGGSTDADMKNTTNQSTDGEKSSTGGGSSSSSTGMFTLSLENFTRIFHFLFKDVGSSSGPQRQRNKGNTVHD